MRRALREQWPALSHLYGLHPWDVDGCPTLTAREVAEYLEQLPLIARFAAGVAEE